MTRYWHPFGRPTEPLPTVKYALACADTSLVSLNTKHGYVDCGFAEDTYWYNRDPPVASGEGTATAKLALNVDAPIKGRLCRVDTEIKFSQSGSEPFRSVHRCWPQVLTGDPKLEHISNVTEFNPSLEVTGFGASLGSISTERQRTDRSSWTFRTQVRKDGDVAGERYDMIVLTWRADRADDRASFAGRRLYSATVLKCAQGALVTEITLKANKSTLVGSTGASRFSQRVAKAVIQCEMATAASTRNLEDQCEEALKWVILENRQAVPEGNVARQSTITMQYLDANLRNAESSLRKVEYDVSSTCSQRARSIQPARVI
jgi:hypothetical protein